VRTKRAKFSFFDLITDPSDEVAVSVPSPMSEAPREMPTGAKFLQFAGFIAFLLGLLGGPEIATAQTADSGSNPPPGNTAQTVQVVTTTTAASQDAANRGPATAGATVPSAEPLDPEAIRRACRDAQSVDILGWTITGVLAATGASLVITGALYQLPSGQPKPVGLAYINGIGPGLILGAIGTPIGRGAFDLGDPLRALCSTMERNGRMHTDNPFDTFAADRVLRVAGAPPSIVLPLLIGFATAACLAFSIIPFVIHDPDLAGPAGGISAAAVAAWIVIPPTPRTIASRRYVAGEYFRGGRRASSAPTIMVGPFGPAPGLSVVGTF
jgi:hypothetical protein